MQNNQYFYFYPERHCLVHKKIFTFQVARLNKLDRTVGSAKKRNRIDPILLNCVYPSFNYPSV